MIEWTEYQNEYLDRVRALTPIERVAHWVREREKVRLGKESGESAPWTDDPIIQRFRFCNVRRMDDRVSKWLLDNWYQPFHDHPLMVPAVGLARFINLPSSLELVTDIIFRADYWKRDGITAILRDHRDAGNVLFNAAYMVRGNDGVDKVSSVLDHYIESLRRPGKDNWYHPVRTSMETTCKDISRGYGFGSFMAGQVVADLRWALKGSWDDRNDWCPVGPGSSKGLNYLHGRPILKPVKASQFLEEVKQVRDQVAPLIDANLAAKLELHDWQNCMCESSKYERTIRGEGKPKQKYPGTSGTAR